MKRLWFFTTIILLIILGKVSAQEVSLSEMKGYWKNDVEDYYYVIYADSLVSLSLINDSLFEYKSKIGFIKNTDPYLEHLDSIQNRRSEFDVPLYLRINVSQKDLEKLQILKEHNINSLFLFDGLLCSLGFSEYPVSIGTQMEIINSNLFSYTKVSDLPSRIVSELIRKYYPLMSRYLEEAYSKVFLTIKERVAFSSERNSKVDIFLLKGDIVEILEEENNWLRIRYYGKETIEGWIKKEDVE